MSLPIRKLEITVTNTLYNELTEVYQHEDAISFESMLRKALKEFTTKQQKEPFSRTVNFIRNWAL